MKSLWCAKLAGAVSPMAWSGLLRCRPPSGMPWLTVGDIKTDRCPSSLPDNDSQRQCHYPSQTLLRPCTRWQTLRKCCTTPRSHTPWGWYIHPCSYCATGLASGGIDPDRRLLEDYSPAQMVVDLQAGSIDGYCVGKLGTWGAMKVGFTWLRI